MGTQLANGLIAVLLLPQPRQVRRVRQVAQYRHKVKMAIGNMEGYQPTLGELSDIESHRFARHKVDRNGVGAKGVNDDDSILPIGSRRQFEPGVAQHHLQRHTACLGVLEIGEVA